MPPYQISSVVGLKNKYNNNFRLNFSLKVVEVKSSLKIIFHYIFIINDKSIKLTVVKRRNLLIDHINTKKYVEVLTK